jgi:hypothetical protein
MSSPDYTVGADGAIIMGRAPPPPEPPASNMKGSAIQAAGDKVNESTAQQGEALKVLGGKMTGGRHRRRRYRGGAAVEVKNMPSVPSADGGAATKSVFASMLQLKADAAEGGKYDALGSAPPRQVAVGGRRRKTQRKGNARRSGLNSRKNRRSLKRTRRVLYSSRRIRRIR